MIVDRAVYRDGVRHEVGATEDDLAALRAGGGTDFLWLGLQDPDDAEFARATREFGLHPLAVEDATTGKERIKVERYDRTLFAVVRTLRFEESTEELQTGELMVFVGDAFAVTVRRGEAVPLRDVRADLEADPPLLKHGSVSVLHAVLDAVVDSYLVVDEVVRDRVEALEQRVFSDDAAVGSADIYRLKREVMRFRRAAQPLSGPLHWVAAESTSPLTEDEVRFLFRDVYDHLVQVVEHVESYDRALSDLLSVHLAQISVRQNDDMRKISAWAAILAVSTVIAGIYGMNFTDMPELHWTFGYPFALALMAGIGVLLYRLFRRSGWL